MNKVIMIGRLCNDPELRFLPNSGKPVSRFRIAVNNPYKKDQENSADFFNVVVFGKRAENCANYLAKGRFVGIEGRLQNNHYEKDGTKYYGDNIIADNVEFLEWGNKNEKVTPSEFDGFNNIEDDDDVPF